MPLDAKVNGVSMEYTPSPLERVYERLTLIPERNFYTKKDGEMTRVKAHPAYLEQDMFRWRANIFNDERSLHARLAEPKREVIEIISPKYKGKISIERDLQWHRILVKRIRSNKNIELRKRFGMNDIDDMERFVRGLY